MIGISIDDSWPERPDLAAATEKQLNAARARALTKMRRKIETMVKRKVAKSERIPQKALGGRVFSDTVAPGDEELTVWIGTWAVTPFAIGHPVQTKKGVRAGRRRWPGAFIGTIYTTIPKVWIRLHSPHYSPELYPTHYRPGDRGWSEHRGRFPVVRAAIPIDYTVQDVMSQNQSSLAAAFEKLLIQELNYEVNVKGQG